MTILHLDFETRSDVDLITRGAFVYFESPNTRVLIAAYRIDGGPVRTWTCLDNEPPYDLWAAIEAGATIKAWNAQFELLACELLADRHGWPRPRLEQFRDTMAAAAAMALPRGLDTKGAKTGCAEALGLDVRKDKEGSRLINKFSKPRKARKDEPPGLYWNEPEDHPEDFQVFVDYCAQDVRTEEAVDSRLVPLSDSEQAFWVLNEKINRRGLRIDVKSAQAAIRLADKAKKVANAEMRDVTSGYVTSGDQVQKLAEWVNQQGVVTQSVDKDAILSLLAYNDLPDRVRRALELRQEVAKASASKLRSFLRMACADNRVRGAYNYHAASTGRTQSSGVNFNNLPRPRHLYEESKVRPDVLFQAFRAESPELLKDLYGPELGRPLHLIADAIRGFIWAEPGYDLVQADYSGIESVVIAWLAEERWKLEAFQAILEDPSLPDMYRRVAAWIVGKTTDEITKKHPFRQGLGKVPELSMGFGGGVAALADMAKGYGVDLRTIVDPAFSGADEETLAKATRWYESQLKRGKSRTTELPRDVWIACDLVKRLWREANPAIAKMWRDLEDAVRSAVMHPGTITEAGKVKYRVVRGFLWALLPSGRPLAYASPRLKDQVWAKVRLGPDEWSDPEVMDRDEAERGERLGDIQIEGRTSAKVTVLGVDSTTKRWRRYGLYGGLIAENNTQAVARDLLKNGMEIAERAGYPIIGTVYDEIFAEVPRGFGALAEFETMICELPAWAEGIPLAAGGWRGKRYRKD